MTTCEHVLEGCASVPLAGYLKALGVFRLVAEQKDPAARGFWRDERFVLKTRLSKEELIGFFLHEFRPAPVISPWNAGSGFYFQEGKTKEKDSATGKRLKTGIRDQATAATRVLGEVLAAEASRLQAYRKSIQIAKDVLKGHDLDAAPGDVEKAALIRALRSEMPDDAIPWIDAAATVTQIDVVFPPLLGSGGNDGNLDFSATVMQAIVSLIDARDGASSAVAAALLAASLFADATQTEGGAAISQFTPSAVGAPNSSVGFDGDSSGNAWDIVLGLEGALVMSTALVRRIGAQGDGAASFPFMISRRGVFGAGAGNVAPADEKNARGEFWAPLWERPAALGELTALFREGRVVVERTIANNALDFAQALGRLGVDRGVDHFERYAFEQRYGNMYLGVPLGRRSVERNPNADLIADITASGWLARARSAVRGKAAPASMLALGRRLDEGLFRLAEDRSSKAVQEVLIAIGAFSREVGRRPKLRENLPPPRLAVDWMKAAGQDDETHEFALAAALGSLDAATADDAFRLPFRRHLGPLSWPKGYEAWDDTTETQALAVWTGRDLLRDMANVLERRLIEAQRREFLRKDNPELPLHGWKVAPLAAVAAFLAGRTDDSRIADLAAGLAWVRSSAGSVAGASREDFVPFAYAALKPLFAPSLPEGESESHRPVNPLPLVRLLRAGREGGAVRLAQRMARSRGLPTPFAARHRAAAAVPMRLVASLLFPIAPIANERLIERAYPDLTRDKEDTDAA